MAELSFVPYPSGGSGITWPLVAPAGTPSPQFEGPSNVGLGIRSSGDVNITSGRTISGGDGGTITVQAIGGLGSNKGGGSVQLIAGDGTGFGSPGTVLLLGGSSDTLNGANVTVRGGQSSASTGGNAILWGGNSFGRGGYGMVMGGDSTGGAGGPILIQSGASSVSNSGDIDILVGNPAANAFGGNITMTAGPGGSVSGSGGIVTINGGTPVKGTAGRISISAKNAVGPGDYDGGYINFDAGTGSGSGKDGYFRFNGGFLLPWKGVGPGSYTATSLDSTIFATGDVTLPLASRYPGLVITIKNASSGAITVNRTSFDTIENNFTFTISNNYDSYSFQSNGVSGWFIVGGKPSLLGITNPTGRLVWGSGSSQPQVSGPDDTIFQIASSNGNTLTIGAGTENSGTGIGTPVSILGGDGTNGGGRIDIIAGHKHAFLSPVDANGGDVKIQSGDTSGTGFSAVRIFTPLQGPTSGSTSQTGFKRLIVNGKRFSMTNGAATTLIGMTQPNTGGGLTTVVGLTIFYTIRVYDGAAVQAASGHFSVTSINTGGTPTTVLSPVEGESIVCSSGTLVVNAPTASNSPFFLGIQMTATSSLTPTVMDCMLTVVGNGFFNSNDI